MRKRVILTLTGGSFEQGIPVTLRITQSSTLGGETVIQGELPPALDILRLLKDLQSAYRKLHSTYRIRKNPGQVTNFSEYHDKVALLASELKECFNEWLNSDYKEWKKILYGLLNNLNKTDEIQFFIQTNDMRIQLLPWHLWDLLSESFTKAEVILSPLQYEELPQTSNSTKKVRILAILGDTTNINVEQDKANLQKQLPNAEIEFITQPTRQNLTEQLWEHQPDILFFAGHSASQADGSTGQICINQDDSLALRDVEYTLRKLANEGLKLAIFNSCDGLGLAQELANLNIPQIIVMRMPVPDFVAQQFLKYFLQAFAGGKPLHLAVREARERLRESCENDFPCASWLPAIYQNPNTEPLIWQELVDLKHKATPDYLKCKGSILSNRLRNLITMFLLSIVVVVIFGLWVNTARIYQEVLSRDANLTEIVGRTIDLAKHKPFSEIRSEIANSKEAKGQINSIYKKVLSRDADPYELNSQVKLLEKKATISLISDSIAKTSSLLKDGNIISLKCLGDQPGSTFLNGSVEKVSVALIPIISEHYTGTKWKINTIRNGVIALENLGNTGDLKWLNGVTYEKKPELTVGLAPTNEYPNTGAQWKFHIIGDGVILLECQGDQAGLTWLNGETYSGKVNLASGTEGDYSGTKWQVIKQ